MTPLEAYNAIYTYSGVYASTICDVRTHCIQYTLCANKSATQILDFDGAAHAYQTEIGLGKTPQSVDAVAIDKSQTLLVFIEKKTWEQFLNYLPDSNKSDPVAAAINKISTYDLKSKYLSTRNICMHITNDPDLFSTVPHVFVFLTEFADADPMGGFATMLPQLACTSSAVDYSIQKPIVDSMRSHLATVPCKKSRYLNCMQLDAFLADPSKFG